jgi:hypothetical protein
VFRYLSGIALPITAKLNPLTPANWLYMAKSAVLTRLSIALMRTWQNAPSKNNNPLASPLEKHQSLWERFFVEILGTTGYMLAMHVGQDLMAKVLERTEALNPNKLLEGMVGLSNAESTFLKDMVHEHFGETANGIISRSLYNKANGASFLKALEKSPLGSAFINNSQFIKTLDGFLHQLNKCSSGTLLAGIAGGVLFGGVIVQFVNDRFFGPVVEPALARLFGLDNGSGHPTKSVPPPAPAQGWVAFDHAPVIKTHNRQKHGTQPAPKGASPFITHLSTIQRTFVC